MFGSDNSRPLLLPIIFDLANLIREGFLRSDKYQEEEKPNHHQFLRRSFETRLNSSAIKEIDFAAPVNYLRDDSLQVEMSEPIIKNIKPSISSIISDSVKAEPLIQILNKNLSIQSTLTRSSSSLVDIPKINISMEEIENLALKDLNGTLVESIKDVNGSEISPMALISRNRKRPSHQHNNKHRNPTGPLPETCERFTGDSLLAYYDHAITLIKLLIFEKKGAFVCRLKTIQ